MPWSRKLKPPIPLKDGRTLVTLKDAADLLLSLPPSHHTRPTWLYAAQLLKDAAEGKRSAIAEVGLQLHRALGQSRMLASKVDEDSALSGDLTAAIAAGARPMRRNASREGLQRFRKAQRGPPGPVPTLGRLQQDVSGKWLWVWCAAYGCSHRAPMAIAPLIIRWGPETSSDALRRSARCSKCGHKGATLQHPSYVNSVVGFQSFPIGR